MTVTHYLFRVGFVLGVLTTQLACREVTSPTPTPKLSVGESRKVIYCVDITQDPDCVPPPDNPSTPSSPGFYQGSDGYYYWDGTPPAGDLSPSVINQVIAIAGAPSNGDSGYVKGRVVYSNGDEARVDLTVNATHEQSVLLNSSMEGKWTGCATPVGGFGHCDNESHWEFHGLGLQAYSCGVSVTAGGTAYARKTLPFGIHIEAPLKWIGGSMPVLQYWGQVSRFMPSHTDPGIKCNEPPTGGGGGDGGFAPPNPDPYVPPPPGSGNISCTYTWEWEVVFYSGFTVATLIQSDWTCS